MLHRLRMIALVSAFQFILTITENDYILSIEFFLKHLEVYPLFGLSENEVTYRTKKYGANIFKVKKAKSWTFIFLNQFLNPIIYILAAATILFFWFQKWLEGIVITESVLTIESHQVTKSEKVLNDDTHVYKRSNTVFKGTMVSNGNAKLIIIAN